MTTLTTRDIQLLSRQLHAMKETARDEIRLADNDLQQGRQAQSSEAHSFSDDAEGIRTEDVRLGEIEIDRTRLAAIEFAEKLIAEGRYGKCIHCGCDIARERMLALPTAARCAPCQNAIEKGDGPR